MRIAQIKWPDISLNIHQSAANYRMKTFPMSSRKRQRNKIETYLIV